MCGRFTRYLSWVEIHRLYRLTAPADTGRNTEPRYNIAPTEDVLFVTAGDGELQFHRVSRAVNSTKDRADSPDMIKPVNPL